MSKEDFHPYSRLHFSNKGEQPMTADEPRPEEKDLPSRSRSVSQCVLPEYKNEYCFGTCEKTETPRDRDVGGLIA